MGWISARALVRSTVVRGWAGLGLLCGASCADVAAPFDLVDESGDAPALTTDVSSDGSSTTAPVDRAPTDATPTLLVMDRFATVADTAIELAAADGVLANDVGLDLRVIDHDATTDQGGTLAIAPDGAVAYSPPVGWGGCDRASYVVTDARGEEQSAAIVLAVHRGGALGSPHPIVAIADGEQGLGMLAAAPGDRAGGAVAIVGDMDGDGIAEVAIGAGGASPRERAAAGRVYVIAGSDARGVVDLEASGFTIDGDLAGAGAGERVAAAGDVNGDGLADLLIAAPRTSLGGGPQGDHVGRVFVVFGRKDPTAIDLRDVFEPALGQAFTGEFMGDHAGTAIAAPGDLDGDGTDDLVIGAPLWGPDEERPGRVYVVFSRDNPGSWRFDQMLASGHAIAIEGEDADAELGRVIAGVGDLDGDGDREIAIASPTRDRVWIVEGPPVAGRIDALALAGHARTIEGDGLGSAIAALGDGRLAIGAADASEGRGRVWILPGTASSTTGALAIDGEHPDDRAGNVVAAAGDIDGDGVRDVWIGAGSADAGAGRTYAVLLGDRGPAIALADVAAGDGGFVLVGTDAMGTGRAISGGVDLDGDAVPDAVIGSPGDASRGDYSGRADLVGGAAVLCE